jgi:sRNA-binding regulator protein Hfq
MVELLYIAADRLDRNWVFPHGTATFEMREIEGGLCEFDKYSRILKDEGRTRSIYKYNKELPMVEDTINGESIWAE